MGALGPRAAVGTRLRRLAPREQSTPRRLANQCMSGTAACHWPWPVSRAVPDVGMESPDGPGARGRLWACATALMPAPPHWPSITTRRREQNPCR